MIGYLFLDIICPSKLTVRYSEQIVSADKYPSIFSRQMETTVYIFSIISQMIIEILVLSLIENGVIFHHIHLQTNFQNGRLALCYVSEERINLVKENDLPKNTKHATKFGVFQK